MRSPFYRRRRRASEELHPRGEPLEVEDAHRVVTLQVPRALAGVEDEGPVALLDAATTPRRPASTIRATFAR
jgi:hypothetical protein